MVAIVSNKREFIFRAVADMYTDVAQHPLKGFHFPTGRLACLFVGYPAAQLDRIPASATESFAGVGYPFAAEAMREGDTVLLDGPTSGYGRVFASLREIEPKKRLSVGVIGLGAGVIGGWMRPGDRLVFYEISPRVVDIARREFTFLADTPARMLTPRLSEQFGRQFFVENKPGAGGTIGADFVAKSPPDGYTLLLTGTPHVIGAHLYKKLPYDALKDFTHIALIASGPYALVVNPGMLFSYHSTRSGRRPPARIAPRSLKDTDAITARPEVASESTSATVSTRSGRGLAKAPSTPITALSPSSTLATDSLRA